jgi:hypothetical protein
MVLVLSITGKQIMKCIKCSIEAPSNLLALGGVWTCTICANPAIPLSIELSDQYSKEGPGKYLYMSDLTNNLDKIARFFHEKVDMNNPYASITLVVPEALDQLQGQYDAVYMDTGIMNEEELKSKIRIADFGIVKLVNPTTQMVL